jgi:hypothetical protein
MTPPSNGEPLVGHSDAVLLRGTLPDTALQALAVDEETIHVADDGGGDAIDHPSGLRMGSSTTVGEA